MKKNRLLLFNNKEYIIYSHILESIKSNRQGKYLRLGELTIKTETIVVKEKEIDKLNEKFNFQGLGDARRPAADLGHEGLL